MTHFQALEKDANAKAFLGLAGRGLKSLWNNGAWGNASKLLTKGVQQGGTVGRLSNYALPVANAMNGRAGAALGAYGMAGMIAPSFGINLPGSSLAMNAGMPVLGLMNSTNNALKARNAGSEKGRAAIQADIQTGADRAAQDYLSAVRYDPNTAHDVNAYRSLAKQIGRGPASADKYLGGGHKSMTRLQQMQNVLENPDAVINNRVQMEIQKRLPGMLKASGIGGKILNATGSGVGHLFKGLGALGVVGGGVALGKTLMGKSPAHDSTAVQNEGYAAAQAGIQHKMQNMSGFERMAARMDPTLAANQVRLKFPAAFKQWEAQHGPLQRGMLSSTLNAFQSGGDPKLYSTGADGSKNFIN